VSSDLLGIFTSPLAFHFPVRLLKYFLRISIGFKCLPDFSCICNCAAVLMNQIQCHRNWFQSLQKLFSAPLNVTMFAITLSILLTHCHQFGTLSDICLKTISHNVPADILSGRRRVPCLASVPLLTALQAACRADLVLSSDI